MSQLPFNDDLGSEAFRAVLRQFNALVDGIAAMDDAPVSAAAVVADLKSAAADLQVELSKLPPRNKNYKP